MKTHKTIIIGGGISGLACAKTLADHNENFLLITKEVGGRMLTSKSLTVDYGASYITTEYKQVLKFLDKGERINLKDICFIQKKGIKNIFSLRNIFNISKMLEIMYLVNDYVLRISNFRERALVKGQKEALREDKVLEHYTKMPALEFVKKHKIEYLHETFFGQVLQSTVFADANKTNAFYYLGALVPLVRKTYAADFRHVIPRITKGFKHNIVLGEITTLEKHKKGQYILKTKNEAHIAQNVVIATPYSYARMFYPVHKTGIVIPIYVFHIVGKREEVYQGKKVVFFNSKHHDITILWKQHTGSDIVFSKIPNPNLEKYYEYHHVIKKIYWRNSLMLSNSVDNWLNQKLDNGLYLASDYNVCGLEDSFNTGVYAAKQIIKSK